MRYYLLTPLDAAMPEPRETPAEWNDILPPPDVHFASRSLSLYPFYDEINRLLFPLIRGHLEHVSVQFEDKQCDMFVDEDGHAKRLPVNPLATAIYRTVWVRKHPEWDLASLADIVGPAVVFAGRIWF